MPLRQNAVTGEMVAEGAEFPSKLAFQSTLAGYHEKINRRIFVMRSDLTNFTAICKCKSGCGFGISAGVHGERERQMAGVEIQPSQLELHRAADRCKCACVDIVHGGPCDVRRVPRRPKKDLVEDGPDADWTIPGLHTRTALLRDCTREGEGARERRPGSQDLPCRLFNRCLIAVTMPQ
mmetsp:Transcript_10266/g.26963  ORF Transcript_10266/g.26963 Transcript_10266/m.26963 type:complete len:179 (+) Transcript_10266:463-999(+)